MNEIPDPLQQLEESLTVDKVLRDMLDRTTDKEGWHFFTGWTRMSDTFLLVDGLTLNPDQEVKLDEKLEVELESISIPPVNMNFNVDVNALMRSHGERDAHRIIQKLKGLMDKT